MTVYPQANANLGSTPLEGEFANKSVIKMTGWTKVMTASDQRYAADVEEKRDEINTAGARVLNSSTAEDIESCESQSSEEKCGGKDDANAVKTDANADAKPSHSYIALIAMAILSKPSKKVLLGDIYSYISENFPYYRSKDKSWRNSIRHNLSLNECFIKAGRSENGKGNYWAIHPANLEDFANGDFRRRRARRRVRKSHSTLCGRFAGYTFPAQATYPFFNYRSTSDPAYLQSYYLSPFSLPNCVRKSSFAIDSLLSSRVSSNLGSSLPSPVEHTASPTSLICPSVLLRAGYTSGQTYTGMTSSPNHAFSYPSLRGPNSESPTESWSETWKKLKAQFQTRA